MTQSKRPKIRYSSSDAEYSEAALAQTRLQLVMMPLNDATRRERAGVLIQLASIYWRQGKYPEATNVWHQVIELARQDGNRDALGTAYAALATTYAHSDAHFRSALEVHQGEKARLFGGRLIEHDACRALALTALDGLDGLAAWRAVQEHPEFPIVGPGPRSDWQFGLEVLANAPQHPAAIDEILALLAQL